MIFLIIILGTVYLIESHLKAIIFSRHSDYSAEFSITENTRFIYNKKNQKLYADFIFGKSSEYVAVLYSGYGVCQGLIEAIKEYYMQWGISIVNICANGYKISGGNKVDDNTLADELLNWLSVINDTFGNNSKIILHGFSYTALATLICSDKCYAVCADNSYIFPTYNYKGIKNRLLKKIYNKKTRLNIPGINVPVFLSSEKHLAKETYKLYELSTCKKTVYVYEKLNVEVFVKKLNDFIMHLKPPEE